MRGVDERLDGGRGAVTHGGDVGRVEVETFERERLRLVATLTALVGVGFAGLAVQAFTQQPWDRLSPVAVGALGLVAVGYAATLARSLQLAAQTG